MCYRFWCNNQSRWQGWCWAVQTLSAVSFQCERLGSTRGINMSNSDCLIEVRICFHSSQVPERGIFNLVVCNLSRKWQVRWLGHWQQPINQWKYKPGKSSSLIMQSSRAVSGAGRLLSPTDTICFPLNWTSNATGPHIHSTLYESMVARTSTFISGVGDGVRAPHWESWHLFM